MNYTQYIEDHTLRLEASHRGGGIEIDVSDLFGDDAKMTAYQNYLGGGMLGSVQNDCNFDSFELEKDQQTQYTEMCEALREYYFNLTNPDQDSWEHQEYSTNQSMPASAY